MPTTNIVIAGLGGQGILTASDLLADVAFRAGHDVKKAEVHGMSQRGGSVTTDVRYGDRVLSPMVPPGAADYLVVLEPTQVEPNAHCLSPGGRLLNVTDLDMAALPSAKAVNVGMLGMLSVFLDLDEALWQDALATHFLPKLHDGNRRAFAAGRAAGARLAH